MCGRYTLTYSDLGAVAAELDALLDPAAAELYHPRYNVAPTDAVVIALAREHGGAPKPTLVPAVWGLHRDKRLIINVRAEQAAARFPRAYQQGRCVVPADGFYEWTGERAERHPIWFHSPGGGPLFMAGLFDAADPPSFAVLTTAARPPIAEYHDRMPVLLSREGARRWLLGQPPRVATGDEVPLAARPVSPRANAVAHDDPSCLEPPSEADQLRLAGGKKQLDLF